MPSVDTLLLFSLACLVLTMTPGPDMLLIASRSVSQGRRAGFACLAGIIAGTYCHALAVALGLAQLLLAVPLAFDVIRFAGAAYLLYLAWQMLRAPARPVGQVSALPAASAREAFCQGLLTNLLNPKMALFVLALFPQFVDVEAGPLAVQVLLLASVLNLIGLLVNGVVIVLAARLARHWGAQLKGSRLGNYLLAGVFAALATRLLLGERS